MSTLMKWVADGDGGYLGYHVGCTGPGGISVYASDKPRSGFEPVCCDRCRALIGYYNPRVEARTTRRLQRVVRQAINNAKENGYDSFIKKRSRVVAKDLINYEASVERMVEAENIGIEDIAVAVEAHQ